MTIALIWPAYTNHAGKRRRNEEAAMANARDILMEAWRSGVAWRALLVALVVGTLLPLINQGDALSAARGLNWLKALLTYLVPFCVSLHGALSVRRQGES
jgi:methyl-accepting chemotaxis protein